MTDHEQSKTVLNAFVGYLSSLRETDNRAALASLRRGMGMPPGEVIETARIVEPQLEPDTPPFVRATCYITGSLFALHPEQGGAGNMGNHFRSLCGDIAPGEELPGNVEKRFRRLLESEMDELPEQLRQAVSLLKANNVPVNWHRLAQDVAAWHFEDSRRDRIFAWSRNFWNSPKQVKEEPAAQPQ